MTLTPESTTDINVRVSNVEATLEEYKSDFETLKSSFDQLNDQYIFHSHNGFDGSQEFSGNTTIENIILTGGVIKFGKTSFTDSKDAGYFMSSAGVYFGAANNTQYFKYDNSNGQLSISGTLTASTVIGGTIIGTSISASTITGGVITGGDIIGSYLRTAPDGNSRAELQNSSGPIPHSLIFYN